MQHLLIALVVLSFAASAITAGLYYFRKTRHDRRHRLGFGSSTSDLPIYDKRHSRSLSTASADSASRRFVLYEKEKLFGSDTSPPPSPVPEIRITFPEEVDEQGKREPGRVVVVRVGEHGGVGLEPLKAEQLPAYQQHAGDKFEDLDLERLGGLKEKHTK